MVPDKLENGTQCCFNKFDCRLFISKFAQFAFYLSLSHSVISKSLAQPFCKCCSLSVSIVLNVRFTTNGMCVMNNTGAPRASRNKISTTWNLYCCLVPQCEGLCTCYSAFPVTNKVVLWPACENSARYQRWSDSGFSLSDPILFLKNDIRIRSESCFGWNHTIRIR